MKLNCEQCGEKIELDFFHGEKCLKCKGELDKKKIYENLYMEAYDGNAEAEYYLGGCFLFGYGIDQRGKEAFEWFIKSAFHGYEKAKQIFEYSDITIDNIKDLTDEELEKYKLYFDGIYYSSYYWNLFMRASFDDADALEELGSEHLDDEDGVEGLAYKYLKRASELGHKKAKKYLMNGLENNLSQPKKKKKKIEKLKKKG